MYDYKIFLQTNPNGVMATATAGQAHTRVFQCLWCEDGRAYFCTSSEKHVFRQLVENPRASFCTWSPEAFETLSIEGPVHFVDDLALKARALEENPMITAMYGSASNPAFQMFYIQVEAARAFSPAEDSDAADMP